MPVADIIRRAKGGSPLTPIYDEPAPAPAPTPKPPSSGGGGGGSSPISFKPEPVIKIPGVTVPKPIEKESPFSLPIPGVSFSQDDNGNVITRVTLRRDENPPKITELPSMIDYGPREAAVRNMNIVAHYPEGSYVIFEGDTKRYTKAEALDRLAAMHDASVVRVYSVESGGSVRKSKGIQPIPKTKFELPGEGIARKFWGLEDSGPANPLKFNVAYDTTGQPFEVGTGVKLGYAANPRYVMAETFVDVSSMFALGSVTRIAAPAAETFINPETGKAVNWLGRVYKGSKAGMYGAGVTGAGIGIGQTAAQYTMGNISEKDVGAFSFKFGTSLAAFGYGAGGKGYSPMKYKTPTLVMDEYSGGISQAPKVEQLNLDTLQYEKVTRPVEIREFNPNALKPKGMLQIIEGSGRTTKVIEPYTGMVIERPTRLKIIESIKVKPIETIDLNTLMPKKIVPVGDIKFIWEQKRIGFSPLKAGGGFRGSGGYDYPGHYEMDTSIMDSYPWWNEENLGRSYARETPRVNKIGLNQESFTGKEIRNLNKTMTFGYKDPDFPEDVFHISGIKTPGRTDDFIIANIKKSNDISVFYKPGNSMRIREAGVSTMFKTDNSFFTITTTVNLITDKPTTNIGSSKFLGFKDDLSVYKSIDLTEPGMKEGLSVTRRFMEGESSVREGGLSSRKTNVDYAISKKDGEYNLMKVVEKAAKKSEYYGEPGGFDYAGVVEVPKNELILPGGIGGQESGLWNKIDVQGMFPKTSKQTRMSVADLEYGVDVKSSYWSDKISIPRQRQGLNIKSLLLSDRVSRSTYDTLVKPITIPSVASLTKSMNIDLSIQKTNQETRQDVRNVQATIQNTRQDTVSLTDTINKTIQNTVQMTTPITTPTKITTPKPPKTIEIIMPPKITIPRSPTEEPPRKPIKPIIPYFPGLPEEMIFKTSEDKPSGYNVYVKDRSYVHGRKRYSDRWVKVNKIPLSEDAALSLGGTAVDQSAAASFKLKETDSKAGKLRIAVDPWASISGKFYRKGNIYIEGTGTRIDSSGEIKGISALGWIASRQRGFKPLYFKQPPQREFKYKPMNINMLMKGWRL